MNCWKKTTYYCWWFRNPDNPLQYVKPYKFSIYQLLIFRNFLGKHQLFDTKTGSQFPTRGPATRGEIPRHTKHLRLGVEKKPSQKGNEKVFQPLIFRGELLVAGRASISGIVFWSTFIVIFFENVVDSTHPLEKKIMIMHVYNNMYIHVYTSFGQPWNSLLPPDQKVISASWFVKNPFLVEYVHLKTRHWS